MTLLRLASAKLSVRACTEKAPWAMVPLKPNELRRDALCCVSACQGTTRAAVSAGMRNDDRRDDTTDDRWAFNLRADPWTRTS